MSKIISTNKLNRLWVNGIKPTVDKVKNTIKNRTDLMDVTEEGKLADALAVKEAIEHVLSETSDIVSENNLSSAQLKTNLLDVDLMNPTANKNKPHKIETSDASTLTNSPITTETFRGKWECIFHSKGETTSTLMVKITEFYPMQGRVWVNHHNYNSKWTGWKDRSAENAIADVYSNRFLQMIANGEKLYVVSNNINDTVYSGGRGFKRNSSEKVIIGRWGTEYWGHYIMGATQESLAYVDATEYGELNNIGSFTTPLGNTVYVAVMKSAWKPSASNYVIANINGVNHIIKERTFTSNDSLKTDIAKWILGIADVELFNDSTLQPLDSNYTISDKFFNNLTNAETKTNLLLVDLTGPNADTNKVHKIFATNTSTLINPPINNEKGFVGKWEYIFFAANRGMVKITELYPIAGRVWSNYYNESTKWSGWKSDNSLANSNIVNTSFKTDMLDVELLEPTAIKNHKHRIHSTDCSDITNSPVTSGGFFGEWECIYHTLSSNKENSRVLVKITEFYPVPGRIWYNHYNWSAWTGWKNDATHSMVDSASTIKANTTAGKVAGALGVKELYNEIKAQLIPSNMKIEADTVTTSGETRTITLKGNYTKMLYFNIGNNANPSFPVFLPTGVAFTAPNKVTFNLKVYGNSGVDNSTSPYATGYIFVGQ